MTKKTNQQAAGLEELFKEIQDSSEQENIVIEEEETEIQIDVLNLPPRKKVHGNDNKKIRFKFNKPLIRLLIVCILLIGISIGVYFLWGSDLQDFINTF